MGVAIAILIPAALALVLVPLLPALLRLLDGTVTELVPGAPPSAVARLAAPLPWLAVLPMAGLAVFALERLWLSRRRRRAVPTWDCGYPQSSPTMQYTATSLAQPITSVLQPALRSTVRAEPPAGLWPAAMSWQSRTPERALVEFYRPAFRRVAELLGTFRRLQSGQVAVYLRYVALALFVLIAWLFWPIGASR
jgi:hypothetical protein